MAFLDEQGLERLWQHVVAKIEDSGGTTIPITAERPVDLPANSLWFDTNEPTPEGGKTSVQKYPATIGTTWTGSAAPYSQEIAANGIIADDTPIVDVIMSGIYATDEARLADWSKIYRIVTGADKITVYAKEATTVELPIQLQVVR